MTPSSFTSLLLLLLLLWLFIGDLQEELRVGDVPFNERRLGDKGCFRGVFRGVDMTAERGMPIRRSDTSILKLLQ
jgi:hypothetical protein